jgi:hypothetical protein
MHVVPLCVVSEKPAIPPRVASISFVNFVKDFDMYFGFKASLGSEKWLLEGWKSTGRKWILIRMLRIESTLDTPGCAL